MGFLAKEIILGLTLQEFLLHLFNLIIIILAIRLLVYKPVAKFMKKRTEEYKNAEDSYNEAVKGVEDAKKEKEEIISDARDEAVKITEEAHALALVQTSDIIDGAREEASEIIALAKEEAVKERTKVKEELLYSISDIAVDISQKILGRELKESDNDVFVDNIVKGISKKDA